jgi:hypothetical protein
MDMRHITADRLVDSTNGAALLELLELLERQVDVVEPFTEQPWEDVCTRADPERVRRAAELAAELPLSRLLELMLIASGEVGSFWDLDWIAAVSSTDTSAQQSPRCWLIASTRPR